MVNPDILCNPLIRSPYTCVTSWRMLIYAYKVPCTGRHVCQYTHICHKYMIQENSRVHATTLCWELQI